MEVTKAFGEKEPFKSEKFCASLESVDAPKDLVDETCAMIEDGLKPGMSTSQIFRTASQYLLEKNLPVGIRYNLKRGVMELGPAGFQFERFVEAIVSTLGYQTERNVFMQGVCVEHEVDVVAQGDDGHYLMEMKYRNSNKLKTNIETVMYADARLSDIIPEQEKKEDVSVEHKMWLVTNAKFTSKAIQYGKCRSIKMTGWSYPKGDESLEAIIQKNNLYPITVLPSVNNDAQRAFATHNLILVHDLLPLTVDILVSEYALEEKLAKSIMNEVNSLFPKV